MSKNVAFDKLSSTKIAQELLTTKQAVEAELVTKGLLVRNGKGFDLTDAGKTYGEESDGQYGPFILWSRSVLPLIKAELVPPSRAEFNQLKSLVEKLMEKNNV